MKASPAPIRSTILLISYFLLWYNLVPSYKIPVHLLYDADIDFLDVKTTFFAFENLSNIFLNKGKNDSTSKS